MQRLLVLLLLTSGCAVPRAPVGGDAPLEISRHPEVLFDQPSRWQEMSLYGRRLGDDAAAIPEREIRQRTDGGWIVARNGCRYRVQEGKITSLGVWDPRILDRLNLRSRDAIDARFGKPESVEEVDRFHIYTYAGGHVRVIWNNVEKRVTAINVGL
jgi:hypothetical protein